MGRVNLLARHQLVPNGGHMTDASDSSDVPTCRTDEYGARRWELPDGRLHREDGPAIEHANGDVEWWRYDDPHRDGGPAINDVEGEYWYQNGELHREDGPAISRYEGTYLEWRRHGVLHRTDGPAIIDINGVRALWLNGKMIAWPTDSIYIQLLRKLGTVEATEHHLLNNMGLPYLEALTNSGRMATSLTADEAFVYVEHLDEYGNMPASWWLPLVTQEAHGDKGR